MAIEVPSRPLDQLADDEQEHLTVLPYKPKATFQWPPDCLWPFMDHNLKIINSNLKRSGR
jgi:hypothetical protein